ncbi:hypothetical protein ACTFIZ_002974 [Dictyostelium cf. discoideum]
MEDGAIDSGWALQRQLECSNESLNHLRTILHNGVDAKQLPHNLNIPIAAVFLHASVGGILRSWVFNQQNFDLAKDAAILVDAYSFKSVCLDTSKSYAVNSALKIAQSGNQRIKGNQIRGNDLKMNNHSKSNFKKSVNSCGNNTNGNSSNNSKSSSGSNGRSNNFNGSASNVASGSNNTKSASGTNNRFQKNKK